MAKLTKAPKKQLAICPCCGTEYDNRDDATEPVYVCGQCGTEGYDCCFPGNNALCVNCE